MAGSGHGSGGPPPSPPRYQYLDLLFALLGAAAFLADLVADLWVASSYVQAGYALCGGLVLALLGLASLTMQLFSWAWYQTDDVNQDLPSGRCLAVLHLLQLGYLYRSQMKLILKDDVTLLHFPLLGAPPLNKR